MIINQRIACIRIANKNINRVNEFFWKSNYRRFSKVQQTKCKTSIE